MEYLILDEGWSEYENLLQIKPYIYLEAIIEHANERGVGIILWVGWLPLNREMEEVMNVDKNTTLDVSMRTGGGWAASFRKL